MQPFIFHYISLQIQVLNIFDKICYCSQRWSRLIRILCSSNINIFETWSQTLITIYCWQIAREWFSIQRSAIGSFGVKAVQKDWLYLFLLSCQTILIFEFGSMCMHSRWQTPLPKLTHDEANFWWVKSIVFFSLFSNTNCHFFFPFSDPDRHDRNV